MLTVPRAQTNHHRLLEINVHLKLLEYLATYLDLIECINVM